jgi:hypothetical protein
MIICFVKSYYALTKGKIGHFAHPGRRLGLVVNSPPSCALLTRGISFPSLWLSAAV